MEGINSGGVRDTHRQSYDHLNRASMMAGRLSMMP